MDGYCNKCKKLIKDMNELEEVEAEESFICSDCKEDIEERADLYRKYEYERIF